MSHPTQYRSFWGRPLHANAHNNNNNNNNNNGTESLTFTEKNLIWNTKHRNDLNLKL